MHYQPYDQVIAPNIVVDGSRNAATVLTLSHWPKSGTPHELKADTSAEIAFKYLDTPAFHVKANVVTNNHFDQDGVVGVFLLTNPSIATRYRDLLIDVASAGDFGVFHSREAARINFAVSSLADPHTSPFPSRIFEQPYPRMAADLYTGVLEVFPRIVAAPDAFKSLWEPEDTKLSESENLVKKGSITIEENGDLDFATVRIPEDLAAGSTHRFTSSQSDACHPLAIYNATPCTRVMLIQGRRVEFQYRYEGWVQLISRRPAARVDLSALAEELNAEEINGGKWQFDGVDEITPRLRIAGNHETSISPETIRRKVEQHLKTAPAAWDAYDGPCT
jgi:hypothetical protein